MSSPASHMPKFPYIWLRVKANKLECCLLLSKKKMNKIAGIILGFKRLVSHCIDILVIFISTFIINIEINIYII